MLVDRKTVFLVDDDLTNLTIGDNTLSAFYDVFTFNSASLMFKLLEKHIPDMILLDVEMPEMNGYAAIKLLKENSKNRFIPVIFLTAKNDAESELEGLSLGAIDYIIKPFSPPLLLKRIELHLLVESQRKELIEFNSNLQGMVEAKTKTVVELQNAVLKTMAELAEWRDNITGGHIERTQNYLGVLLGELLHRGLYREETSMWDIDLVLQSTQLHDVGKIVIHDNILQKPGKLTEEEFEIIKGHVKFGEKVIDKIKKSTTEQTFLDYAKVFAGTHHENWDGTGYPRGLKGQDIPLLGRLMAIVDVYDALASERPYKKAFTHEEAVKIIAESSGIRFDPEIVELFLNVSGKINNVAMLNREIELINRENENYI
ncbi:MAG: response regulator [Treponema sp.]|nr:response regulator [Treponema sp.]